MDSANGRRRYIIISSLIGWAHTRNIPRERITTHVDGLCEFNHFGAETGLLWDNKHDAVVTDALTFFRGVIIINAIGHGN